MRTFASISTSFSLLHLVISRENETAYMSTMELIRYWGYPAESYDVTTEDGYILELFRIPYGLFYVANSSCHRPAVLMAPGFIGGSVQFLMNPSESSPALILADAGFDVFLLNNRGTSYGKRHSTLQASDNKFWQFSLDELAKFDAPAVIDKALNVSGQKSLYWLGHSQGSAIGFMMLSERPEYNRKLRALFQLGPAGTYGYAKGLMRFVLMAYKTLKPITDFYRFILGSHEIVMGEASVNRPLITLCEEKIPFLGHEECNNGIRSLFGSPAKEINSVSADVFSTFDHSPFSLGCLSLSTLLAHVGHLPGYFSTGDRWRRAAKSSIWTTILWRISSDMGRKHLRPTTTEDVPVYLFWSRNDWMTTAEEIDHLLLKILRKAVVKGGKEVPSYNHVDFVHAMDCAEKVYNPITAIVRRQESEMCRR